MIAMYPEFIDGCNFNTYSQNFVQLLVFLFPNITTNPTGDMFKFAVTPAQENNVYFPKFKWHASAMYVF